MALEVIVSEIRKNNVMTSRPTQKEYRVKLGLQEVTVACDTPAEAIRLARIKLSDDNPRLFDLIQVADEARFQVCQIEDDSPSQQQGREGGAPACWGEIHAGGKDEEVGGHGGNSCLNSNHRRAEPSVRHCPNCGEIVNGKIPARQCSEQSHARKRMDAGKYCVDCGQRLNK